MRKIPFLILFVCMLQTANAQVAIPVFVPISTPTSALELTPELEQQMMKDFKAFLELTPSKFKEITGKKLSLDEVVKLKAAQKMLKKDLKKNEGEVSKGLYIVLAILGLGFIAMGILDDWKGNNWWLNLILSLLCWIPGVIHALIKMKDYYK